jgi:hypothetical protein
MALARLAERGGGLGYRREITADDCAGAVDGPAEHHEQVVGGVARRGL